MNKYGMTYSEIDAVHTTNPELAAHNIALAYIQATTHYSQNYPDNDEVVSDDIFDLSQKYIDAYNYAYNFVEHQNKIINEAE